MKAVHRAGGYSRDELVTKTKEELYKLPIAALKRMLGQFEQLESEAGGELPKKELGYKVYYQEELELLESGEETAWLTKCMGVVLSHTDIEQFHVKTPKEVRSRGSMYGRGWFMEAVWHSQFRARHVSVSGLTPFLVLGAMGLCILFTDGVT